MKKFIITLKHDTGRARIQIYARNKQAAIRIICIAEKCPECAIEKIIQVA